MCGFQISSFFLSEDVKDQIWRCEFMDFSVRRSTNPVRLTRRPSANNSSSFPGHPGTGCKGSVLMPECFTSVFRSSLHHFLAISISFGVPTKCTGGQCWFHYDTQFSKKKKKWHQGRSSALISRMVACGYGLFAPTGLRPFSLQPVFPLERRMPPERPLLGVH